MGAFREILAIGEIEWFEGYEVVTASHSDPERYSIYCDDFIGAVWVEDGFLCAGSQIEHAEPVDVFRFALPDKQANILTSDERSALLPVAVSAVINNYNRG